MQIRSDVLAKTEEQLNNNTNDLRILFQISGILFIHIMLVGLMLMQSLMAVFGGKCISYTPDNNDYNLLRVIIRCKAPFYHVSFESTRKNKHIMHIFN